MSIGNICATFYSYILYIFDKKGYSIDHKFKDNNFSFFENKNPKIAIPMAFSAYIQTSLKTVKIFLYQNP